MTLSKSINLNNTQKIESNKSSDNVLNDLIDIQSNLENEKALNNLIGIEKTNDTNSVFEEGNSLNIFSEMNEKTFNNFLDLQFYNIFRERIIKDFATEEIYFASGFNIANKREWSNNIQNSSLYLIYDVGHFKSKSRSAEEFRELFRNSFVGQYNFQFPIWKKSELDTTIDKTYKYTPQ